MNIAVCDNDRNIADDIARLVKRDAPSATVRIFASGEDFLRAREEFAVVFLDIRGIAGLSAARILRKRQEADKTAKTIVIFVTGYREYMEEAFDVNAFHYLLKPVDVKKFSAVFLRALKEAAFIEQREKDCIMLKTATERHKIFADEIFFVESSNKKVVVHTEAAVYETYGTMESFAERLPKYFFRCHRCYIVNFAKIAAYNADGIRLTNGGAILLSRKKYGDFVKAYMSYAKEGGIVNV